MKLSIVVPVYKEERNVPEFLRRITPILSPITEDFEIIFALDPSPDRTESVIRESCSRDNRVKLLKFSRRFGQPAATLGGLQYSSGDAVIVMDVDLQDPPELIHEMVRKWQEGFDVVYAQRRTRDGETLIKRVVSYLGYLFINKVADVSIPPNTGDFRLMSRRAVDEIVKLKESHGFLRGMVAVVGFKQAAILFDRPSRFSGQGNYNRFLGSLRIGMNGVVCFSNYLLTMSLWFGAVTVGFAVLLSVFSAIAWLFGGSLPFENPGLIILVTFFCGVQLLVVGILGEYVGRIYDEVKQRPKFIVDEMVGFER